MTTTPAVYRGRDQKSVSFRISRAERAELDSLAKQLDMSISELIRQSLEHHRQKVAAEAAKAAKA